MKTSIFIILTILATAFSCENRPYLIYHNNDNPDGSMNDADAEDADSGDADADSGPICIPPGTTEICNNLDDDCDGVVDNGFDKMNDPSNCGTCGHICTAPNATSICVEGECVISSCTPGYADLDEQEPGCEYRCPLYPPQDEDCNGIDDDCDGVADEPEDLPAPPVGICNTTPGTPCAGTVMVCDSRGTPAVTTWYCNYGAGVEFDPRIPNGIYDSETLCDGHDGDCDGIADDEWPDIGQECDNGGIGACRDYGEKACDPLDPSVTFCDLSVLPDADPLAPRAEVCNGADDNCDGIVDNPDPVDPARVIDDMIHINHSGFDFWIYRYEASRPDSTPFAEGVKSARSCSKSMVLPWANVSYSEAASACASVGKRLCTASEWQAACEGSLMNIYPYGMTYEDETCNGYDYDTVTGGDNDDTVVPTGSMMMCSSDDDVYDLSGNLREWTNDQRGTTTTGEPVYVVRGGEYHTPYIGLTCAFDLSQAAADSTLPTIGFRCCSDTAP